MMKNNYFVTGHQVSVFDIKQVRENETETQTAIKKDP